MLGGVVAGHCGDNESAPTAVSSFARIQCRLGLPRREPKSAGPSRQPPVRQQNRGRPLKSAGPTRTTRNEKI
jgi:hypothetical protein